MLTAAVVLIAYLIALVTAGHGALPMGALLVIGGLDSWWASSKVMGWIGIFALIAATLLARSDAQRRLTFQLLAAIVLFLSWLVAAYTGSGESGSFWSSAMLSIPFHLAVLSVAYRAVSYKRAHARSLRAP
jgi:hypothetical protein